MAEEKKSNLSELVGKLVPQPCEPRRRTLEEFRRSWEARTRAFRKLLEAKKAVAEGYIPSDVPHPQDVAFGVTKKKRLFLSADMVKDPETGKPHERTGGISHIMLLWAGGLAKTADDPKPDDDYAVRGIVKADLGGRVIFWEETPTLTAPRYASFVKLAVEQLLKRKLIQPETEIYGSGEDVALATAEDIVREW